MGITMSAAQVGKLARAFHFHLVPVESGITTHFYALSFNNVIGKVFNFEKSASLCLTQRFQLLSRATRGGLFRAPPAFLNIY